MWDWFPPYPYYDPYPTKVWTWLREAFAITVELVVYATPAPVLSLDQGRLFTPG